MRSLWHRMFGIAAGIWLAGAMSTAAPATGRAVLGVVPSDTTVAQGLEIAAVAPGSPAERSGLQAGDILLAIGGKSIRNRSDLLAAILPHQPGDTISVHYMRENKNTHANVMLAARKQHQTANDEPTDPGYKEHGDRMVKLLNISPELLEQMRTLKRTIRRSLSKLPEDAFDPAQVSRQLQQLRDLARDAQAHRQGWMTGRACEAYLQFHDTQGTLVLHGANNMLTLEVYDTAGQLLQKAPLNTDKERKSLSPELLQRLHDLR